MVIYRDGQPIGLTREECRKIYDALDIEYKKEDVRSKLNEMEIELDDGLDVLVDRVDCVLGRNDSYWDSYWCTIEYAIEEYIKEKEVC